MDDPNLDKLSGVMRKVLWLTLMLALFVPGFSPLEALAAGDNGERTPWPGIVAGTVVGVFFGLVIGGARPRRWADATFGPSEEEHP